MDLIQSFMDTPAGRIRNALLSRHSIHRQASRFLPASLTRLVHNANIRFLWASTATGAYSGLPGDKAGKLDSVVKKL